MYFQNESDYPFLKVVVEGMGGTIYIVEEDHNKNDKGKRAYVASIGVGEDCFCKDKNSAMCIAERLVSYYNRGIRK